MQKKRVCGKSQFLSGVEYQFIENAGFLFFILACDILCMHALDSTPSISTFKLRDKNNLEIGKMKCQIVHIYLLE